MSKKPTPSIHARVLGDASIVTGVTTIDPMAEIIFAAALYLVLQRKEPISRRTIQALLWPDALVMLPAYEPRFSQAYLEWLDSQKAEVNSSMTRVMLGIIARHRVKGEWVEVERNATRLLRFQPYNEEATL